MADKDLDVSRAKDGKVKLVFSSSIDLDVTHEPGNPPDVTPLDGKTIEWLAFFNVKKKNKTSAADTVKYKIKLTGSGDFIFWPGPGSQAKRGFKNGDLIDHEGDPAVGIER